MSGKTRWPIALATLVSWPLLVHAADAPGTAVLSGDDIAKAFKAPVAKTRGLARRPDPGTPPPPQSVNLDIPFKYNSSTLESAASAQLKQLELALVSESLRKDRFVIAGHTDAKGNPRYNKQLSLKRATSVKKFLVANGVEAERLEATGVGSEEPLKADNPEDPANRRVEIRDLGSAPAR
jgi:OmpA-OmpF porin, OOP family